MNGLNSLDLVLYSENGELNAPYVLANANLLYKEGEYRLAGAMFLAIARNEKYSYCAYYGLGRCFTALFQFNAANQAFEKAFKLAPKPYIGLAWLESMIAAQKHAQAEKMAIRFAVQFADDAHACNEIGVLYNSILSVQKNVVV